MENPTFHLEGVVKSRDDVQDFEGPLSLILMLLSKNKIEIRDISISDILDQYLAYLDEMQRMDLEVEVSRLKLLRADHLSQRYALEDRANKELPQRESRLLARIEGLEADLSVAEGHPAPPKEAFAVSVAGIVAATRAEAGDRLAKMCRSAADCGPSPVGEYRGFALEGGYDAVRGVAFARVVGAIVHRVDLGDDGAGNMTRIDNAIDRIGAELDEARSMLADVRAEIVSARSEAAKPFAHERELKEKSARLAQISAELDVGKTDAVPVDEARDEEGMRARPAREPDLSR